MFSVQFALRIICNRRITETVKKRLSLLTKYLGLSDDLSFSPYWKDDECDIFELDAKIENPDYSKIQQYIQVISGAVNISQRYVADEWECAYFAPLNELHSSKNSAFVVCNIF